MQQGVIGARIYFFARFIDFSTQLVPLVSFAPSVPIPLNNFLTLGGVTVAEQKCHAVNFRLSSIGNNIPY